MCNLYKMTKTVDEVARLFGAVADPPGNAGDEVFPGYPGYVVAQGRVRQMIWGFPLVLTGKNGQPLKPKPVNNTRADKLDSYMQPRPMADTVGPSRPSWRVFIGNSPSYRRSASAADWLREIAAWRMPDRSHVGFIPRECLMRPCAGRSAHLHLM